MFTEHFITSESGRYLFNGKGETNVIIANKAQFKRVLKQESTPVNTFDFCVHVIASFYQRQFTELGNETFLNYAILK